MGLISDSRRAIAVSWRQGAAEVMLFCLPALAVGLALRIALMAGMPWGYVQYDTCEYLATAHRLLSSHSFYVDGKRGFLVPILFAAPFLLRVPALIAIPLCQHLLGLAGVVMSGGLVRLWFRQWRWFIVPVTLWFAASPFALWYEQTLMGESEFLFSCVFLALAGTLWARRQSRARFGLLLAALVCAAGARPEGRLFFLFGVLLIVIVLWGQWRRAGKALGAVAAVAILGSLVVRSSTAPQLLYASLIQLAPDHSRLLPGVENYIGPLRDKVRAESKGEPLQLVKVSKQIRDAIDPYLWTQIKTKKGYYPELNRTLRDLCLDAMLAHPWQAMAIPWQKFRLAVDGWSSYRWDEQALRRDQEDAYLSDPWMFTELGRGLTGRSLDEAGMKAFVEEHYRPEAVAWVARYEEAWNGAMLRARTADRKAGQERWVHDFAGGVPGGLEVTPGVPWFYPLALAGMAAAMVWPRRARPVHWAWAPVMLAVWAAATFVGVTNARYRFAYEPFCWVYLCLLADYAAEWAARLRGGAAKTG